MQIKEDDIRHEKLIQKLKDLLNVSAPNISNKELFNLLNELIENDKLDIPIAFTREINALLI